MKTKISGFFAFIFVLFFCASSVSFAQSANPNSLFMSASGMCLISTAENSHMKGLCTAVAFAKNEKKYLFLTAGHCVADYDEKTFEIILQNITGIEIIMENQDGTKRFFQAKILESKEKGLAIGEKKNFEDFAILEAETDEDIPIMPLSDADPELDEDIRIATVPFGLAGMGILQLRGYVSKEKTHIKMENDIKIEGASAIQIIGLGPVGGFSGGGVLSVKRNAIVGAMIIYADNKNGHTTFLVDPISKFNNFYKEYLEGKRHVSKPEPIEPTKQKKTNKKVKPKKR